MKEKYKTIVISDVHLGIQNSRVKELVKFLKKNVCETLILNGDIIDGWRLKRSGEWKKKHTRFFRVILKAIEKQKTKVIYLRGNHDDFLNEVIPFEIGSFSVRHDYIHESCGKKYYVVHGDIFDPVTTKFSWLAKLGDAGYTLLLWINRKYNYLRESKGYPYHSISQVVKQKVKSAVSFISDFENHLAEVARNKNCHGIICGHIHQSANKMIGNIHYLNSGDWVESLTALTESEDGNWEVIRFTEWEKQQNLIGHIQHVMNNREAGGEDIYIPALR
jgi:UDP-2,3-diacylglucosamine pyrophosphatase LpxH